MLIIVSALYPVAGVVAFELKLFRQQDSASFVIGLDKV